MGERDIIASDKCGEGEAQVKCVMDWMQKDHGIKPFRNFTWH